jgi:hypothetical protein
MRRNPALRAERLPGGTGRRDGAMPARLRSPPDRRATLPLPELTEVRQSRFLMGHGHPESDISHPSDPAHQDTFGLDNAG